MIKLNDIEGQFNRKTSIFAELLDPNKAQNKCFIKGSSTRTVNPLSLHKRLAARACIICKT